MVPSCLSHVFCLLSDHSLVFLFCYFVEWVTHYGLFNLNQSFFRWMYLKLDFRTKNMRIFRKNNSWMRYFRIERVQKYSHNIWRAARENINHWQQFIGNVIEIGSLPRHYRWLLGRHNFSFKPHSSLRKWRRMS